MAELPVRGLGRAATRRNRPNERGKAGCAEFVLRSRYVPLVTGASSSQSRHKVGVGKPLLRPLLPVGSNVLILHSIGIASGINPVSSRCFYPLAQGWCGRLSLPSFLYRIVS